MNIIDYVKFLGWKNIALFLLGGIIILMILFDKDPVPNQEKIKALEFGLAISDQEVSKLRSDSVRLRREINRNEEQRQIERNAYRNEVKKKDAIIANLRANPIVIKVREETKEVDMLLDALEQRDSVKSARIFTLENNIEDLQINMDLVNSNCAEMLEAERESNIHQSGLTKEYKKQLRKERRKVKFLKIVAVVGTVGAFVLGAQL